MDHGATIALTSLGIAAVGTHSPALAADAWLRYLDEYVPVQQHPSQRLDQLDWLRGARRWAVQQGDRTSIVVRQRHAPEGAPPALVLLGTYRGRQALVIPPPSRGSSASTLAARE